MGVIFLKLGSLVGSLIYILLFACVATCWISIFCDSVIYRRVVDRVNIIWAVVLSFVFAMITFLISAFM